MRSAFIRTLAELAERDPRILLLTGDLGYTAIEPFADRFPDRFFNIGVAEQNMVGLATGLAEAGFVPFVYSIATFASLRPYEFIRNGPVLQRLPVRIVGVGGGFEYGPAGPSHHALEDVGVLRLQPGLTVVAPADHQQTRTALGTTYDLPGPVYYRIGKDDRTLVPGLDGRFQVGRAEQLCAGDDLLIVAMGAVAGEASAAAAVLAERGVAAAVVVVSSFNPTPLDDLAAAMAGTRLVLSVESHYITGGLGSALAEIAAERALGCRLIRCGVRGHVSDATGSQRYLEHVHGISAASLADVAGRELALVGR